MAENHGEQIERLASSLRTARDPEVDSRNASAWLLAVQTWQARRLAGTYADLARDRRFTSAAEFFLQDLYGEQDVAWRDRDVVRILPTMRRWLPAKLLEVVSRALELDLVTHKLDLELASTLATRHRGAPRVDVERYAEAYRLSGTRADRERQLGLLLAVGADLDRLAHAPFLGSLLRLARGPAKAAGLRRMQEFLEKGFAACLGMGKDGAEFLAAIERREQRALDQLFAGAANPFDGQEP